MTEQEYMDQLKEEIGRLDPKEQGEIVQYVSEYFQESGHDVSKVISLLGTPQQAARTMGSGIEPPFPPLPKETEIPECLDGTTMKSARESAKFLHDHPEAFENPKKEFRIIALVRIGMFLTIFFLFILFFLVFWILLPMFFGTILMMQQRTLLCLGGLLLGFGLGWLLITLFRALPGWQNKTLKKGLKKGKSL